MKQEILDSNVSEYKISQNEKWIAHKALNEARLNYKNAECKCDIKKQRLIHSLMDNVKNFSGAWYPISYDQIKYITLLANRIEQVQIGTTKFIDLPNNSQTFQLSDVLVQIKYQNKHICISKTFMYTTIEIRKHVELEKQIKITVRFIAINGDMMDVDFSINKE